ncbi:mercury methylation corrinoid protein HgcA [Marinilabilia sp.]|uniref:mercury methylation corrinoid protein HgcA n=1 Tax=Marinilabilia sp. TaxID=2021252 RepID=UPI0025B8E86B|nr:mercury methylation corrinoid protein HgcA [Marinilabilia sp.]
MKQKKNSLITGTVFTQINEVPQVATKLNRKDYWGAVKVRWLIGRDHYLVAPGLYATGKPDESSDVFVTANYKLSFDHLRKNLDGINAWILVLDTKGVNVWCAAGKGTFGTSELVHRIRVTRLGMIVNHRKIIVPQLGAVGIAAHLVKSLTTVCAKPIPGTLKQSQTNANAHVSGEIVEPGFRVIFGPVRAKDIKAFIQNRYQTTTEMRTVTFNFSDRIKLLTVDIVYARYKLFAAFAIMFLLSAIDSQGINLYQAINNGLTAMILITLAYFTGILITPVFLPYIPVRMFAFKGLISGFFLSGILFLTGDLGIGYFGIAAWFLLLPAISSFMTMNFTGASTFTSLSGVKKEMKIFVPIQIFMVSIGLILYVINNLT